jgi:hypothetical protein
MPTEDDLRDFYEWCKEQDEKLLDNFPPEEP